MSDAADFAQHAPGVTAAESLREGKFIHAYDGELADEDEPVRFLTLAPEVDNEDAIESFRRTAAEWANTSTHPNIVSVYDRDDDPRPWIAVEDVTGQPLDAVQPSLSPVETKTIVADVAEALRNAVLYNAYHLDLRPNHVWVVPDEDDVTGLVDEWGLERSVRTAIGETDVTPFTPPEVISNPNAGDEQTDVYGLGALAYFALTGQPPITVGADMASAITAGEIQPPSKVVDSLSADVDEIVMQALATDPADRPDSTYSFKQTFAQAFTPDDEGSELATTAGAAAGATAGDPEEANDQAERDDESLVSRRAALGMLGIGTVGIGGGWMAAQMGGGADEPAATPADTETATPADTPMATPTDTETETPTDAENSDTIGEITASLFAQHGLAYHEGSIYYVNDNKINEYDTQQEIVVNSFDYPTDGRPRGLAYGDGSLWFADKIGPDYEGEVAELDPGTGEVLSSIRSSWDPRGLAFGEGSLWAVDITTNRIVEYSTEGDELSSFDTGDVTWGLGLAYFDGSLWLGNNCNDSGCTVSLREYNTDGELLQRTGKRSETGYGGLAATDSELLGPDADGTLTVLKTL